MDIHSFKHEMEERLTKTYRRAFRSVHYYPVFLVLFYSYSNHILKYGENYEYTLNVECSTFYIQIKQNAGYLKQSLRTGFQSVTNRGIVHIQSENLVKKKKYQSGKQTTIILTLVL